MRNVKLERKTKETEINVKLILDGQGDYKINTGIDFFDHMLSLFSRHGLFDLEIETKGDLKVDQHHTVEDIGIVLGKAFATALGKKEGIRRYGFVILPMDESLSMIVVDLGGRPHLEFNAKFKRKKVGDFDTDLIRDFFEAFVNNCSCNLHIKLEYGRNDHHKAESIFKGFGRVMRMACEIDPRESKIPTTKGMI